MDACQPGDGGGDGLPAHQGVRQEPPGDAALGASAQKEARGRARGDDSRTDRGEVTRIMLRFLIGGLLIVHGLITVAQSLSVFGRGTEPENPAWLSWWPTPIGRSWLLGSLGLEGTAVSWLVGALWVLGGITLLGAGFGILAHYEWWRTLAVV